MSNIIAKQIYFLRLLSTVPRSEIKLMLKPQSRWIPLSSILDRLPDRPIHSRLILRNEFVMEIDSDDWAKVRDGTRRIVSILNEWGAESTYYLSFSGNHSIHVHAFLDISSIMVRPDVASLLEGHDDVIQSFKSYLTLQIAKASSTVVDMQLTGNHMIRMEGGFNEKSKKYCTMIHEIPDEKPAFYDVVIPDKLPLKTWNLCRFESEINTFLKVHYSAHAKNVYHNSGRKIDPEPLKEILKPVYIPGYRHWIVLSLAGWLKRHSVSEPDTLAVVKALDPDDSTPSKTKATIHNVYRAREDDRVPGLPKLISVLGQEARDRKIPANMAEGISDALVALGRGTHVSQITDLLKGGE